ncbi:NAD(P)-binding protein [Pyrenochaeta sp. DS3sAY3a]|nr:NAD(P)-binding protein [Pyrenochaeta sp. DS3sAY3a]
MSNNPKPTKILVLGAGELGTALLTSLSTLPAHTYTLTLGVRSPQSYTSLATSLPSLSILPIDLSSPSATLIPLFSAYDILISATGFAQSPSTLLKLAHEALGAGALRQQRGEGRLWFFPWQWGVDYDVIGDGAGLMPLFGAQREVREVLRREAEGSAVQWTVVSTGIFMSFLFEPFWGVVERGVGAEGGVKVRCLRDWTHKVTVTDVHDIGRVLARIVAGDVEAENRVLYVAGDTVSYGDLVDIVQRVSGKQVEREEWSIPMLEEELKKEPEDGIKRYRLVFARDGVWWDKHSTVNHRLGMKMMDVDSYSQNLFTL